MANIRPPYHSKLLSPPPRRRPTRRFSRRRPPSPTNPTTSFCTLISPGGSRTISCPLVVNDEKGSPPQSTPSARLFLGSTFSHGDFHESAPFPLYQVGEGSLSPNTAPSPPPGRGPPLPSRRPFPSPLAWWESEKSSFPLVRRAGRSYPLASLGPSPFLFGAGHFRTPPQIALKITPPRRPLLKSSSTTIFHSRPSHQEWQSSSL